MDFNSITVSALTGGLAGAFLNQIAPFLISIFRKPVIQIEFSNKATGCVVTTNGRKYFRVKIKNVGNLQAKKVNALVSSLVEENSEIYDAKFSGLEDHFLDIPAKTHRFVDILSISEKDLNIETRTNVKKHDKFKYGTLYFKLYIGSENAKTLEKKLKLHNGETQENTYIIN